MVRAGFAKKLFVGAVVAALGMAAGANQARAGSITFASFQDTAVGSWHYDNASGTLTVSTPVPTTSNPTGDNAFFISFPPPNQILNFSGGVIETLNASVTGAATHVVPSDPTSNVQQGISGTLSFQNGIGGPTILSVAFVGAVLGGPVSSQSSGVTADNAVISGQITSYTSNPAFMVGTFHNPFSFSISLTQIPGLNIADGSDINNPVAGNYNSFTATAQGSFSADSSGTTSTPAPASVWGGLGLMGALGDLSVARRRKIA